MLLGHNYANGARLALLLIQLWKDILKFNLIKSTWLVPHA